MSTGLLSQLDMYYSWIDEAQNPIHPGEVASLIDTPVRELAVPVPANPRRGWLTAVAAAATVLVLVGGAALLLRVTGSDSPVATTPPIDSSLMPGIWSPIPHDESVLGGPDGQVMVSVTVGGPGFVAVGGDAGNAAVWTSVDAVTWKRVPDEGNVFGSGDQGMSSVTVGGPGLVAVGGDGADIAVWTSVDGVKWSRVVHDEAVFGDASVFSVIEGGPGLVAVGSTEPGDNRSRLFNVDAVVWTSVDGLTWSRVPHDETVFGGEENQIMNDVTVGGPGLVAVGYDGCCSWDNPLGVAAVWTSIDGVVWSRVPHDDSVFGPSNEAMVSVTAGGPGLVAVGYSFGCRPVWTSVDGITWSRVTDDVPGTCNRVIRDVIATEGGLVAVGHGAGSWTSVDGTNWIQIYGYVSDSQGRMLSVTETDSGLVAVGAVGLNTGSNGDGAVWLWNG